MLPAICHSASGGRALGGMPRAHLQRTDCGCRPRLRSAYGCGRTGMLPTAIRPPAIERFAECPGSPATKITRLCNCSRRVVVDLTRVQPTDADGRGAPWGEPRSAASRASAGQSRNAVRTTKSAVQVPLFWIGRQCERGLQAYIHRAAAQKLREAFNRGTIVEG